MSSQFETNPEQMKIAEEFLSEVYPDTAMIVPGDRGRNVNLRFARAGFGVAEIIFEDGSAEHATYVAGSTKYTRAIERIFTAEIDGDLPEGSHIQAMDDIGNGEFCLQWGEYLK